MSSDQDPRNNDAQIQTVSSKKRGGPWLPLVLATIGVGVILSGIFSAATGLYGDVGDIPFGERIQESGRELVRLILFSCLLLGALRINCWRIHRPLGNIQLAILRCVAIVALVEAVRVAQIPHGIVRIVLIIAAQYIVCCICTLGLFSMTIREVVLFVTSCTIGVAMLWMGSHIGTWIA